MMVVKGNTPPWPENNLLVSLARQCASDSQVWFPEVHGADLVNELVHHTLAMCGEAGELANLVKKIDRGSLDVNAEVVRIDLRSELADVFIYVLNVAAMLHIDLLKEYIVKREFNDKRFNPRRNGNVSA
jgi:NTP pyrophosphatase (non-canonical NTP hydrolase)